MGIVMVAASHNEDWRPYKNKLDGWPSRFGDPNSPALESIPNLIIVSGIDKNTRISPLNPYADWLVMAPGWNVNVPGGGTANGASLCKSLTTE